MRSSFAMIDMRYSKLNFVRRESDMSFHLVSTSISASIGSRDPLCSQRRCRRFVQMLLGGHDERPWGAPFIFISRRGGDMAVESEDFLSDASINMCRMGDWSSLVREETSSSFVWIDRNEVFWTKPMQGKRCTNKETLALQRSNRRNVHQNRPSRQLAAAETREVWRK